MSVIEELVCLVRVKLAKVYRCYAIAKNHPEHDVKRLVICGNG